MRTRRWAAAIGLAAALMVGCDDDDGTDATRPDAAMDAAIADATRDEVAAPDGGSVDVVAPDAFADAGIGLPDAPRRDVTGTDVPPPDDAVEGDAGDVEPTLDVVDALDVVDVVDVAEPTGLPTELPFVLERPAAGEPLDAEEVERFTKRLVGFWAKVGFFDWLHDTSFGVHPSTGKRDFKLWWTTVQMHKEDGAVVFGRLPNGEGGGGHNLMTRSSKVLASTIAGYLLTGDERMARVAEQYCKGVTATMIGMVHDETDPIDHLMARNIVPFDHEYTLDGDRRVIVDYSSWRSPYDKWNCSRFRYENNPSWGDVWVTNMRSKDDVSRLLRSAAFVRYAMEQAEDEALREACTETYEHLEAFARDIVDSGYWIRTKDEDGATFHPGGEGDPHPELHRGDLGTYVQWEAGIPNAECNAKRAAALLGYRDSRGNDCGKASGNLYEEFAIRGHYFNIWIIRSYHLSNIMQSLTNREDEAARVLLEGLVERYEREGALDPAELEQSRDVYDRDLAASMMQATGVGYPLDWEEARMIHRFVLRAIDEYLAWPYWDPWDPEIPDGVYDYRPPHTGDGTAWIRPEDMATILETCWSPFRNPAAVPFVDCDLVAEPSRWDPAWADGEL